MTTPRSSIPLRLNLVGSPAARLPTASRVMGGSGSGIFAGVGNDVSDHVTAPCQRCTIYPSCRCQAPGTSWIYSRIGPDRIQVKPGGRSSFLLGDAHDESVGLSTDAATNSRDARGWRLWRFAAWRGRVAPNSAPRTPITAVLGRRQNGVGVLGVILSSGAKENPSWGAPRIHGELLKLGFEVAQSTVSKYMAKRRGPPSQGWRTFLRNHADAIAAIDLCVVPTLTFERLLAFVVLGHGNASCSGLRSPGIRQRSGWLSRFWKRFPDTAPAYLVRDNDAAYGRVLTKRLRAMGICDWPITPRLGANEGRGQRLRKRVSAILPESHTHAERELSTGDRIVLAPFG